MEDIPTEHAVVDENGRQVSQYCLGLPTILRQILEQFSTKELLELSLVNKLWNFEARSVMRERGNLSANSLRGGRIEVNQCQKLVTFASDLEQMRVIPISGIRFIMSHRNYCQSASNGSLDPPYKVILDRIPWKHFSVRFYDDWDHSKDCPALVLVKRILEDYSSVLEDLTIGFVNEEFLRNIFQDRTLSSLKTLTMESSQTGHDTLTSNFIKALVSSAPNLQELHVNNEIDLTVDILEGRSSVALMPMLRFRPLFKPIREGLVGSIRSDDMEILVHRAEFDLELLNRFIPKILEASRTTLKTFVMDFLFAVPFMCYGICLENVRTLEIHMNCPSLEDLEPSILKLPTGLDFTRVFPKLTNVTILDNENLDFSSDVVSAFVEEGTAVLSRALPDRATNIKCLRIDRCSSMDEFTLPVLAEMFPDVTTVYTNREHQGALFEDLREHFPCLEEVTESEYEMAF